MDLGPFDVKARTGQKTFGLHGPAWGVKGLKGLNSNLDSHGLRSE